jgi:hypothetical protein
VLDIAKYSVSTRTPPELVFGDIATTIIIIIF